MHNYFIHKKITIEVRNLSNKNIIQVCRGTICHVKKSINILKTLENELNIKVGETTKDNNFAIEIVTCLDACSISPVIRINDDYYGRIDVIDIPNILNKYRIGTNDINDKTLIMEREINI